MSELVFVLINKDNEPVAVVSDHAVADEWYDFNKGDNDYKAFHVDDLNLTGWRVNPRAKDPEMSNEDLRAAVQKQLKELTDATKEVNTLREQLQKKLHS